MNLTDVRMAVTAHKRRKRVGRGAGSGFGKTSGRGNKGLGSRTGDNRLRNYIGGQTQLKARLPKRGFNNKVHQVVYVPVNLKTLDALFDAGAEVTAAALQAKGVTVRRGDLVKVLATGDITKKLTVKAHAVSAAAKEKIEKAGGTVEIVCFTLAADRVKAATEA